MEQFDIDTSVYQDIDFKSNKIEFQKHRMRIIRKEIISKTSIFIMNYFEDIINELEISNEPALISELFLFLQDLPYDFYKKISSKHCFSHESDNPESISSVTYLHECANCNHEKCIIDDIFNEFKEKFNNILNSYNVVLSEHIQKPESIKQSDFFNEFKSLLTEYSIFHDELLRLIKI